MLLKVGRSFVPLLVAQFALSACAASARGSLEPMAVPQRDIVPGSTVALAINSDTTADAQEVVTRLRERLFGALVAEGLFTQVVPAHSAAGYDLEVNITEVNKVSTASRVILGVLGGRNRATASVRLSKSGETKPVRSFTATGESAAHPASSESGMEDAVRLLAQEIMLGLHR